MGGGGGVLGGGSTAAVSGPELLFQRLVLERAGYPFIPDKGIAVNPSIPGPFNRGLGAAIWCLHKQ